MIVFVPNTFKNISSFLSIIGFSFLLIAFLIILYDEGMLPSKVYSLFKNKFKK